MSDLEVIKQAIMMDSDNQDYTKKGIEPLFAAPKTARILIIGQAPGLRAQESGIYFKDPSGNQLRDWLGIDEKLFYESGLIAVMPMDFYFPGPGKSGDLPPRKGFAEKWHHKILKELPDIKLTLLIGAYAQHYYLKQPNSVKITDNVRNYQEFLPEYFPLVHPSPRNNIWQAKNPWFKEYVLPELQTRVAAILAE